MLSMVEQVEATCIADKTLDWPNEVIVSNGRGLTLKEQTARSTQIC